MERSPISASLGAMSSLPRKLDELLATKHWTLRGVVMDEIDQLAADLCILYNFMLKLSDAPQDPPMAARYWMKDVRELSYDMEDFADQFVHAHCRAKIRRAACRKNKIISRFKIDRIPERRKWRPWITDKISEFNTRAQEAIKRYRRYKFDNCGSNPGCSRIGDHELPTVLPDPDNLVGIENPTNELERWLINGEEQLKVVSIVGVAGIGKTTLALKLWGKLRGQFECGAFVRTAQKPDMRGILRNILLQVRPRQPPNQGEMRHLINDLREYLQNKRYFVIIDDLWAISVWDVVSRAFPPSGCCSRIITTTEIMEVALACCCFCPEHIFKMEPLSDNDSEKLLLQRILVSRNQSPQQFDDVIPQIMRSCGGLPLAIIIVARILASQPEKLEQWGSAQNSFDSIFRAKPTMEGFMRQILNICFINLPHYLKTCLLHLSTYPEGYLFLKVDLVKQWVAEAFICANEGEDMEEVAGCYFEELVCMGLIQAMDINCDYELLSYSVHQLVLDLITYKSIEENFITVVDYAQTTIPLADKVRRLSLLFGSATYATTPASTGLSQVRSLFFSGLFDCMPSFVVFKLLRVLVLHFLDDTGTKMLNLTGICELFRLRYLQVTCNVTVKLPDKIEAMKHLETLEINARIFDVPPDIVRLSSLLHLCLRGANLPSGIGCIRSLRTLMYFDIGNSSEDNLWGLGGLTNLRDLHLTCSSPVSSEHLKRYLIALASSLGKLCNLKSLTLAPGIAGTVVLFDGSSDMSTPMFLERLELLPPICIFSRLPKWIGQLHKICIIKVAVRELPMSDIAILTGLPSLTVLSLSVQTAPEGRIVFNDRAFPVLKYFKFRCGVLCMSFMAGAMPNLHRLKLGFNAHIGEKYDNMLAGIEHLLTLQYIAAQIGATTESDWRAAESAINDAIDKHPRFPRTNLQWVDPIEEESRPSEKHHWSQEKGSSGQEHRVLEKAYDLNKHADSGLSQLPDLPSTAASGRMKSCHLVEEPKKSRMKTGCVALVLCLNIGVDPPDVIKISPCARMECWIDPFSMAPPKVLETIGKTLHSQYERWQPKARYKLQLDPTVEEVKKLCNTCRKYARSERVLFHYNGHGVPKPTANGEIWVFNKSYTQYIPLPITDLDSWLKTPSIYVFDCSAAGMIVKAFLERLDWSMSSSASSLKDCILLAACEAHQTLPQSAEYPADVFTACLTTPIKMALHWFCKRLLLRGSLDNSLIDQIPGSQNDRKTLLGELNWIFTAITDTIAWNVLPHELFQRLFRQDILVASLFRNFLLAERIMRSANCSPITYPLLPPTHQHHMWDAWDMAAEICLSKLPCLIADPNAEFQPSPFFTEQLTAFEVWLDHGSEDKKPPEQLPIVLQVLLSRSHRFRALVLLGRFLDMGPWAVDLALSVGIFPYVLKLLQTSAMELRQILVFIWAKILSLDKSCQVDLVKDGGHAYFIRLLDSLDAYPEQRAMAAFVLAVIVDGHRRGQEACMSSGLIDVCLRHLQPENPHDAQTEPLLLQWLCLCLGKLWEDFPEAQLLGLQSNAPEIVTCLLSEPQPEVRASAVFALGNLLDIGSPSLNGGDDDSDDDERVRAEINVVRSLLQVTSDGSPLVRAEVSVALTCFALGHNKHLKSVVAEYRRPQTNSLLKSLPSLANLNNPSNVYSPSNFLQGSSGLSSHIGPVLRGGSGNSATGRDVRICTSSPIATHSIMHGSPQSDDSFQHSDSGILLRENASNGGLSNTRSRPIIDSGIYSLFISTMCSVAKDPYPRIANIGRRALSLVGVEQVVMRNTRFGSGGAGETSASPSNIGMARSSSWYDMNPGISMAFRTPPVSPPQHDYLAGLRHVCSMEFRPHLLNSPDGLADPLLSSAAAPSTSELNILPQSTIYDWSCGHFSRPLLTGSDDKGEVSSRREERERAALDCIAKCQRSSACKMTSQIASWDTKFELGTKSALLLPFSPIVVAADENEQISVWNYDDALPVNTFENHKLSDRGLSKLLLINELDESLLLVGSSDGNVHIWRNYTQKGGQKLVTAFSSVQFHRAAGCSVVIDWQQQSGYLYASGDMSSILVWDLDKEQLLNTIPSSADSGISALSASQVRSGQFAAGFIDASVKIFDVRTPDKLVYTARPHAPRTEKVVGIGFQPGFDPYKIVSASQAGDIQFLDVRRATEPYLTIEAHRGSLTALAVHRHAPVIASGSAKQMIKVFSLEGEQLTIIRYQPSFMGQRIGSVNCLSFHPYKSLLAAGAGDNALVSIYAEDN